MSAVAGTAPSALALEMTGIGKRFGAVRALDRVHFAVAQGSVHALLGENGAGKSTLMRIAYGLVAPDTGVIHRFGASAPSGSVRAAVRSGVGMVHQQLSLVPALTAAENVALGAAGRYSPAAVSETMRKVAEASGLRVAPDALVRDLSIVEQQRLEIVKALARGARLLVLDEPTTGLAPAEIDDLLQWIRGFANGGGSVVLVTHRLREALAVADDVTVLRRGVVADSGPARTRTAESLARAIFPDAVETAAAATPSPGEVVAELRSATVRDNGGLTRIKAATLQLRRGEILGVAAVEGSGHRELLALLAGTIGPSEGIVTIPRRIALIPSNRLRDAMVADFTLAENFALRGAGARRGRVHWGEMAEGARRVIERFTVVADSPQAPARTLSGGNQQRFVVGRELADAVDLVVADDPGRGLDFRASQFVRAQLRAAAAAGAAVLFHATDLDEVLSLAARVVVVFHGTVRECPPDRDLVGRAMLGAG